MVLMVHCSLPVTAMSGYCFSALMVAMVLVDSPPWDTAMIIGRAARIAGTWEGQCTVTSTSIARLMYTLAAQLAL